MTLELGGKSAAIFLDDADLEPALEQFLPGAIINNGEACSALTRILVPETRHDEILGALCATFAHLPVGDPFDEATVFGPLITAAHRERVEGYISLAREEGATIAQGGARPAGLERGYYVEPTILSDVTNDMRVAREEIFGPVLCVIPYRSEAHAVALANDSPYGLAGCVYTSDPERGFAVAQRVRAGTLSVNGYGVDVAAPFGGSKQSGLCREGGVEGLAPYFEPKALFLPAGFTPAGWATS